MSEAAGLQPLIAVVTSDLGAIVRGRSVAASVFDEGGLATGVGWLPANIALTPFNGIADNPFGSQGDLRLLPDRSARFRTAHTGSATPFDLVFGDLQEMNGSPWPHCPRTLLREAAEALRAETGLHLLASFEQEFQLLGTALPDAHALSFAALRRADPFAARLMACLEEAGIEPEVVIAEFGKDQFEITCAPSSALVAADRCLAIREITRELARLSGWRASFAPKIDPEGVGNGLHIHFSLVDEVGVSRSFDPDGAGRLSGPFGAFCAGVVRHMRGLTGLSAPSVASYQRLKPHNWSASYTWLGEQDREASLRICPVPTFAQSDPARQFNVEYRAADGTCNPYLALAGIVWAGLAGIREGLVPRLFAGDPEGIDHEQRGALGLHRLPQSLGEALDALDEDALLGHHLPQKLRACLRAVKQVEIDRFAGHSAEAVCAEYAKLY